jgi:hypothetical protein
MGEESHFEWTFQDAALGALSFPDDDSIPPFYVRVFFALKHLERRPPSRYYACEERCRNNGEKTKRWIAQIGCQLSDCEYKKLKGNMWWIVKFFFVSPCHRGQEVGVRHL